MRVEKYRLTLSGNGNQNLQVVQLGVGGGRDSCEELEIMIFETIETWKEI